MHLWSHVHMCELTCPHCSFIFFFLQWSRVQWGELNNMQTSKPRKSSSEISQRTSPAPPRSNGSLEVTQRASPVTPKSTRATKTSVESESTTPKYLPSRTPVDRSPKNIERRSPRSPVTERKRPSRMTELESQLTQVQEDLKKAKDQLGTSESWRRRAQQEAEEAKKQLIAMNTKLEGSQRQVIEFSAAEEARLQELRKISEERDCAWQSELEATQKQQYIDSNALTKAMNEIDELKQQLAMVVKSDDVPVNGSNAEHALKQKMAEALLTIEQLEEELKISRRIEAETQAVIHDTQQKFEMAKANAETLSLQGLNLRESVNSKTSELQELRARVALLEGTVKRLQTSSLHTDTNLDTVDRSFLESEVEQLKYELEEAEIKYQGEQIQSTVLIRSAYEFVESVKVNFAMREAELESALKNAKAEIFECKASLIDKETQLQCISEMNKELTEQIEQSELEANLIEVKVNLLNKETELQSIIEENELLKADMAKSGSQDNKSYEIAIIDMKLAREAERDALMKLGRVSEEADKSSRRAAKVAEQLEAAQVVNSEMEAELRRLRVQSDQWRKAAEAAAAALSPGDNGRFVERTSSLDIQYQSVAGKLMSSPFSDDLDDDWPKKKNNIVMRKISGLWKKSPK